MGDNSGGIATFGTIGAVKIGGDIVGGAGESSGLVYGDDGVASVTAFSIKGGAGNNSGGVAALDGRVESVLVKGSIIGGSIFDTGSLANSGGIIGDGIGKVVVNGSIIAGVDNSEGTLARSGGIISTGAIGSVTVKGSLIGNITNPVIISARTGGDPATGDDITIGSLTVGRNVTYTQILAGFDGLTAPANADAAISKIVVGGSWRSSSVVAGAYDTGGNGQYGVNDALQTVSDNPALTARIASIQIKGAIGGGGLPNESYGFVAQQIDSLKIAGKTITLDPMAKDNFLIYPTGNVHVLEVG